MATVTYPNNVQSTFTYDKLNRVTGLATSQTGYAYQRGPTGNLSSELDLNNRQVTWSYDGIYRLTNETIANAPSGKNGSVGYGLDPVGNRSSETSSLSGVSSGSWNYNADDEVSSESYDNNGNVLAEGGKTFSYDSQNQLVSMNGGTVQIVSDGDGNRVAKTVNGVTTKYLVDDLNPTGYPQVVDELSGGVVTRTYTYGLQRIAQDQVISNTWTPSFYEYDGGGNVRTLTNTAGAITDSYEYDAYGNHWTADGSTPNNMLYQGEEWDSDLSLLYLRARYYNPLTGRFVSRDPDDGDVTDPATLHRYLYAHGDPVNLKDPTGKDALVATIEVDTLESVKNAVAAITASIAIQCAYNLLASETAAWTSVGLTGGGDVTKEGACSVKSCKKASNWQLKAAGITDPHAFKADWVGKSNLSSWDICACSDGTISLKPVGQCGTGGSGIETGVTWK